MVIVLGVERTFENEKRFQHGQSVEINAPGRVPLHGSVFEAYNEGVVKVSVLCRSELDEFSIVKWLQAGQIYVKPRMENTPCRYLRHQVAITEFHEV